MEIKEAGYQKIRDFIQANWKYIEIRTSTGTKIVRLTTGDSRVNWTHIANARVLELTVILKGSDSDIALPKTFGGSALFDVASEGTAYSEETFTPFTMETAEDQITIKHRVQVPKL